MVVAYMLSDENSNEQQQLKGESIMMKYKRYALHIVIKVGTYSHRVIEYDSLIECQQDASMLSASGREVWIEDLFPNKPK